MDDSTAVLILIILLITAFVIPVVIHDYIINGPKQTPHQKYCDTLRDHIKDYQDADKQLPPDLLTTYTNQCSK